MLLSFQTADFVGEIVAEVCECDKEYAQNGRRIHSRIAVKGGHLISFHNLRAPGGLAEIIAGLTPIFNPGEKVPETKRWKRPEEIQLPPENIDESKEHTFCLLYHPAQGEIRYVRMTSEQATAFLNSCIGARLGLTPQTLKELCKRKIPTYSHMGWALIMDGEEFTGFGAISELDDFGGLLAGKYC